MISGIIGLPGSGKSTLLSYIAYRAVNKKSLNFKGFSIQNFKYDYVYTNFPFQGAYKLDFELLGKADFKNCLMICDEIQLFADCRNYRDFGDDLKDFFSMHRHDKIDFVYATQLYDGIDKKIRGITDRYYKVDSWLFNFIRCREILAYQDVVHGRILEGYEYARGINTKYFYAPRLYKYNDTYACIKERIRFPVPMVPWDNVSVNSSVLSSDVVEVNTK